MKIHMRFFYYRYFLKGINIITLFSFTSSINKNRTRLIISNYLILNAIVHIIFDLNQNLKNSTETKYWRIKFGEQTLTIKSRTYFISCWFKIIFKTLKLQNLFERDLSLVNFGFCFFHF